MGLSQKLRVTERSQVFRLVGEATHAKVPHGATVRMEVRNVRVDKHGGVFFCDISGVTLKEVISGKPDGSKLPYVARIEGSCAPGYHDLEVVATINGQFDMKVVRQRATKKWMVA